MTPRGLGITAGVRSQPEEQPPLQFWIFEVNTAMHGVTPTRQLPRFVPSSVPVHGDAGSAPAVGTAAPLRWLRLSCPRGENPAKCRLENLNHLLPFLTLSISDLANPDLPGFKPLVLAVS